ncbi:MAG: hypothetical protein P8J87_03940 [Verrucomicrobiales bacterium]|nr:hypothetical protein [Verrucomicrobiales bacterium]
MAYRGLFADDQKAVLVVGEVIHVCGRLKAFFPRLIGGILLGILLDHGAVMAGFRLLFDQVKAMAVALVFSGKVVGVGVFQWCTEALIFVQVGECGHGLGHHVVDFFGITIGGIILGVYGEYAEVVELPFAELEIGELEDGIVGGYC